MRSPGWLGHDPELTLGVMNDGHSLLGSGADGPAATEEIDLVVCVDAPAQVEGQVEIHKGGIRTGPQHIALLSLRLSASLIRRQAGGTADCPILPFQFVCQHLLSWGIGRDFLVGQEGEHPLLKGVETTFDLSLGLGARGDQMGDAQGCEGSLELGTWVAAIGGGLMAEERQTIGVKG